MNIKKIVTISLIVFAVFIFGVIILGLLIKGKPNVLATEQTNIFQGRTSITLSSAEIAKHNSASDCWMVIGGKVYDVTKVINIHPGGPGTIISHCGAEATGAWNSKDSFPARMHSMAAQALLQNYLLGDLNQVITAADFQNAQQKGATASGSFRGRGEDEFED